MNPPDNFFARKRAEALERKRTHVPVPRAATLAKKLIGKRVEWEYAHDRHRGTCLVGTGMVNDVQGRNIWINGDPKWLPDLINLKEIP